MKLAFDYYPTIKFLFILEWIFYILIPISMPILVICNSIELENIGFIKNWLHENDDDPGSMIFKLYILRVVLCVFMTFPMFFITDEYFLISIIGVAMCPLLGLIIPVR